MKKMTRIIRRWFYYRNISKMTDKEIADMVRSCIRKSPLYVTEVKIKGKIPRHKIRYICSTHDVSCEVDCWDGVYYATLTGGSDNLEVVKRELKRR
jgi:hypothetical protein